MFLFAVFSSGLFNLEVRKRKATTAVSAAWRSDKSVELHLTRREETIIEDLKLICSRVVILLENIDMHITRRVPGACNLTGCQ